MPLTAKGEKILSAMVKEYGEKRGKEIFYSSANSGKITGVHHSGPKLDMKDVDDWLEKHRGRKAEMTAEFAWKEDVKMSAEERELASPDALFADPTPAPSGDSVRRKAPMIFPAGKYEFQNAPAYEMTPDDIRAAVADFAPVEIDDNHRPTHGADGRPVPPSFFKGKLGKLVSVKAAADHSHFGGEIEIPRWLDTLYKDKPIPLSATWDRETRRLKNIAITPNPRIPDAAALPNAAALFAAFAAEEARMDTREKTPHGQKHMQYVHDISAMRGAVCKGEHSPTVAGFTAAHEADTNQKIHDLTLGSGAACAIYKENLGKNKTWRPGQYYDTAAAMMPRYSDYKPGQYALMTADEAAAFARQQAAAPPPPADTPEVAALKQQLAAFAAERDAERQRLESERRAADKARIAAEAVAFADALFHDERITPPEHPLVVTNYRLVAEAVAASPTPPTATFTAEDGTQRTGTPLDAYKARELARPKHVLTTETVEDERAAVLFSRQHTLTEAEAEREEAVRKAEEHAARRNKVNGVAARN